MEQELICYDNRKSFYGKAKIIFQNGEKLLKSYDTIVCKIDKNNNFVKLWNNYSYTTMRHINSFLKVFNIAGGGKTWWENLEVAED